MDNLDIIHIHEKIIHNFDTQHNNMNEFKSQLDKLNIELYNITSQNSNNIRNTLINNITKLEEFITDIESRISYNFYMIDAIPIINQYKNLSKKPIKISFFGNKNNDALYNTNKQQKHDIIIQYLRISNKYININIDISNKTPTKLTCSNCSSTKFKDIDNTHICLNCGNVIQFINHISSYTDIDRVNLTSKYTYDRGVHFRDCINQFQGKQNVTILPKVYSDLIEQFHLHGLLLGDETTPKKERFRNITKKHILLFLKETGHAKHYEDVVLLHFNITGVNPPDISYLEPRLLEDFNTLIQTYYKLYKDNETNERKTFINTLYVLLQLLRKYKYNFDINEFKVLKTKDIQDDHDDVGEKLFNYLGWNFKALFK
jgi:hypothetical protein